MNKKMLTKAKITLERTFEKRNINFSARFKNLEIDALFLHWEGACLD